MARNIPNLTKSTGLKLQEIQWTVNIINSKKYISRHIIIKLVKAKGKKKFKQEKKSQLIKHKRCSVILTTNFSSEAMDAGRQYDNIFKVLKRKEKKNC